MYYNKYAGVNLEPSGIYLTEHDAFALPKVVSGVFTKLGGGGKRTYAKPRAKQINLTLKIDNSRHPNPDYALYEVIRLFSDNGLAPLVIAERPDRYIECISTGGIITSDSPGFTSMSISLIAPMPFFKSFDTFDMTDPPSIVMEGNAPHFPVFTISGPALDPVLTIENDWGTFSRSYEGSLGSSDEIVLNTERGKCTFNGGLIDSLVSGELLVCAPNLNKITLSSGSLRVTGCWWYY